MKNGAYLRKYLNFLSKGNLSSHIQLVKMLDGNLSPLYLLMLEVLWLSQDIKITQKLF